MAELPEIQQERKRRYIQPLLAARVKSGAHPGGVRRGKKGGDERNGRDEGGNRGPQPHDVEKPKSSYPTGPTPNAMEKRIGHPHRPLDSDGRAIFYNFSAHSGCAKGNCSFPHQSWIQPEGLHWAAAYELDRRGGVTTSEELRPNSVEVYLQSLRAKNTMATRRAIEESRNVNGRILAEKTSWVREDEWTPLADSQDGEEEVANGPLVDFALGRSCDLEEQREGPLHDDQEQLSPKCEGLISVPDEHAQAEIPGPILYAPQAYCDLAEHVYPRLQQIPHDFLRFGCAEMENP